MLSRGTSGFFHKERSGMVNAMYAVLRFSETPFLVPGDLPLYNPAIQYNEARNGEVSA